MRDRVGWRVLSDCLNDALRRQLQRDQTQDLLTGFDEEMGPSPEHVMEEIRDLWPAPGG